MLLNIYIYIYREREREIDRSIDIDIDIDICIHILRSLSRLTRACRASSFVRGIDQAG